MAYQGKDTITRKAVITGYILRNTTLYKYLTVEVKIVIVPATQSPYKDIDLWTDLDHSKDYYAPKDRPFDLNAIEGLIGRVIDVELQYQPRPCAEADDGYYLTKMCLPDIYKAQESNWEI
jgi:hypothetical protein